MEDGYYNDSYDKVERGLSFPGGFHSHGILDQLKAIVHAHFFIIISDCDKTHKICHYNHLQAYSSMGLSTFTGRHHHPPQHPFHLAKMELDHSFQHSAGPPPGPGNHLSTVCLHELDSSGCLM